MYFELKNALLKSVYYVTECIVLSRLKKFVYWKNVVRLFVVMFRASLAACVVQTTDKMETEAFDGGCIVVKILVGGSWRVISPPEAMT